MTYKASCMIRDLRLIHQRVVAVITATMPAGTPRWRLGLQV
jgi:hypothetical protein